jgi:enoyl-[acyl-carrier protein] reductase III
MKELAGKRALVTGGSGAIGKSVSTALAAAGAEIVLTYFSDRDGAEATAAAVTAAGSSANILRVNFADDANTATFLRELATHAPFDIFISNAASGVVRPTAELLDRHWNWSMSVNATSLFRIVQMLTASASDGAAASPKLRDGGRIIALSSLGADRAIPQYAAVGASKAAMMSLVRNLCVDLGPRGITANVVSPGLVMTRALQAFPNREQLIDVAKAKTPAPRLVTPEDVAGVVRFLCSDAASMISGQTLHVDGGYTAVA